MHLAKAETYSHCADRLEEALKAANVELCDGGPQSVESSETRTRHSQQ